MGAVKNLSVSLLLHRITFAIDTSIGSSRSPMSVARVVEQVKHTLKSEGGFEVTDESGEPEPTFLDRFRQRKGKASKIAEERHRRHLEHCETCRAEKAALDRGEPPTLPAPLPLNQVLLTTLSIEGMTCASCTTSITKALEGEPSIISVDINLLSSSGTIRHKATLAPAEVAELVDDVGFEAEVIESRPEAPEPVEDLVKTTLSIEGMTCASCSGAIDRAVRQNPDVTDVAIDVLLNKGVFTHKPALTSDALKDMVEDVGYDAEIVSTVALEAKGIPGSRTVTIGVQGTFCNQCVDKINAALGDMPLLSYTPVTLHAPVTTLSYIPRDPLTIRDILGQLTALAPEFDAEVVRQQSLSERSQEIQRREVKLLAAHLAVAVLFAIPTFIIAIVSMVLLKADHPFRRFWDQPVWGGANLGTVTQWPLATVVQFGVGWIFYKRAFNALWPHLRALVPPALRTKSMRRLPSRPVTWRSLFSYGSMDLLVTLSTTVSYFASIAMMALDVRAGPGSMSVGTYYDSSVFLIMFILLGRTIEAYAKSRTTDAVALLGNLRPATALLVDTSDAEKHSTTSSEDAGPREVPVDHVEYGDVILIQPGSLPPTDGVVVSGTSKFDESSLTGESLPVTKNPGDEVYTGTTNQTSAIQVRVTGLASETMLERIIKAVSDASGRKAPLEKAAERITGVFVPLIVYLAIGVLAFWLGMVYGGHIAPHHYHGPGGRAFFALEFAIAVLVVACPCGIGLAVPCANAVGNGLAAAAGILASGGGEAFTAATTVTTIAFDKTGTLTAGKSVVTDEHVPTTSLDKELVKRALRDIETQSTHPLAVGLVEYLSSSLSSSSLEVVESAEIAGRGLRATVSGERTLELLVGNAALLAENGVELSTSELEMLAKWSADAKSVVLCATRPAGAGNPFVLAGMYALADAPRETTPAVLALLRERGYKVVMLSGDNEVTARAVGRLVGIDAVDVHAGVGPEGKAAAINGMQVRRTVPRFLGLFGTKEVQERVMFVGDGLNDAVALAAADVSAAMGHGSQATLASADFVLLRSDLAALPKLLKLSRKVRNRQWFNLFWAMVFNTTFLPIAAGVLFPVGFTLSPVWSAVLMACSSISVVLSSLALRWGL
ncbi:hypothetical protein CspHIS471_0606740 [Cutaneotrichosporon sp. HIS471]|nr:hypothetical protein CspHIS471_0606740 [Cutaneotrichosporon sp. HIS471]